MLPQPRPAGRLHLQPLCSWFGAIIWKQQPRLPSYHHILQASFAAVSLGVLQTQTKAVDEAAEAEAGQQAAASLRVESAQEDSLAAAAALARLGIDLRKSEVPLE